MSTAFEIHGMEFDTCNCAYGCPCQFNALPTNGTCEYVLFVKVDKGHCGDISLDDTKFVLFGAFPGPVHEGNGQLQLVIDDKTTEKQQKAIRSIVFNEGRDEMKYHFAIYSGLSSTVHEPIVAPIELEADIASRTGKARVPGLIESSAEPIRNPVTGAEHRAQIVLPEGFEYTVAEMGSGTSTTHGNIPLHFANSYAQFNELHLTQDGVIR